MLEYTVKCVIFVRF